LRRAARWGSVLAWIVALVIVVLNLKLPYDTFYGR